LHPLESAAFARRTPFCDIDPPELPAAKQTPARVRASRQQSSGKPPHTWNEANQPLRKLQRRHH